jgi:TM2 domain-containing membrane protein YozV
MSDNSVKKSKAVAVLLALFVGGVGAHKFYLGRTLSGVVYLLFCWTLVPSIIAACEAFAYLAMSKRYWETYSTKVYNA